MKSFAAMLVLSSTLVLGTASVVQAFQPAPSAKAGKAASAFSDLYTMDTCPISGEKLGSMGDPVVKVFDGREVRFCCKSCPPKFEKDLAKSLAKLDEAIIKDQRPLYPVETSIVSGKALPAKPVEWVYHNRLVLLAGESEKAEFLKDPAKHLSVLDKAVIAAQGKDYSIKTCPVSGEKLGGMGEPVNVVLGGRLVRLCCNMCEKDLKKNPAKFIAIVDAARSSTAGDSFRKTFDVNTANLGPTGVNPFFDLTPGTVSVFKDGDTTLTITVLEETKVVDGVTTRVIEEREEENGKPTEISRNYFAIDRATLDVYYFGEDVDVYDEKGQISHPGGWLSGANGAHFGLMMPGTLQKGDRYYQELAPDVAMDRFEVAGLDETVETPAGKFEHCVHMIETTPLEKDVGHKWYARGKGLIKDGNAVLTSTKSGK